MQHVVITGANRGIGLELARHYHAPRLAVHHLMNPGEQARTAELQQCLVFTHASADVAGENLPGDI